MPDISLPMLVLGDADPEIVKELTSRICKTMAGGVIPKGETSGVTSYSALISAMAMFANQTNTQAAMLDAVQALMNYYDPEKQGEMRKGMN